MNHYIPNSVSSNQRNEEQCRKFLAGNRSCFYRGFWKNAPFKGAGKPQAVSAESKEKHTKN